MNGIATATQPLLSIIVPVYNVEGSLENCVLSILKQEFIDFELLLINDGSTDNSAQVCDKLALQDGRIKVFHKQNAGVSQTRNYGLDRAKGTYIGWVDGDDWIEPDMFALLMETAVKEHADLVWCSYFIDYGDGQKIDRQNIEANSLHFIKALIGLEVEGMLWNKVIRRDIFENYSIRFIDKMNMAEDKNVLIKVLYFAKQISFVDKPLYHYLQTNPISYTRDTNSKRIYEEIANAKDACLFLQNHGVTGLSEAAIRRFKLHAKRRLLFSVHKIDLVNWAQQMPESNTQIFKEKSYRKRHKLLALFSIWKWYFLFDVWIWIKSSAN
ncbi:glycosyltransferase family 2 protein [Sphingobacterium sp. Mn56C]|uniref:glycosyltransferase family 2 protein n=1 Tax=Sphingobacterium sp. Mn56C TaxID=3395261 RepID=UPI003BBC47FE